MVAIIVVCVGFLLFMIVLGVIRIRAAHRRTVVQVEDKMVEMEWDNSALNITVNPMEQKEVRIQSYGWGVSNTTRGVSKIRKGDFETQYFVNIP